MRADTPKPRSRPAHQSFTRTFMLFTIAAILIILWILGLVTAYTLGGFIHILLVVAVIMVLIRIINGQKVI